MKKSTFLSLAIVTILGLTALDCSKADTKVEATPAATEVAKEVTTKEVKETTVVADSTVTEATPVVADTTATAK